LKNVLIDKQVSWLGNDENIVCVKTGIGINKTNAIAIIITGFISN